MDTDEGNERERSRPRPGRGRSWKCNATSDRSSSRDFLLPTGVTGAFALGVGVVCSAMAWSSSADSL
eukprot:3515580-Pyramimonas_sp.AAC.1